MCSGIPPTPSRRWVVVLAAGLAAVTGCSRGHYDEQMEYPVRTDYLVRGTDEPWGDLAPTGFNRPGVLPLDGLRLPQNEQPPDSEKLKTVIGKKVLDPTTLKAEDKIDYAKNLKEMFGTPARPKVSGFEPAALKAVDESLTADSIRQAMKLDDPTLVDGSELYRRHCLHCHGLEGNGRGPTGPWLNPPPRDYRQGVFKYTSSTQAQNSRKPRRDDIMHVLTFGIEGTSMPAFNILSVEDREKLTSYVIHLSIRGDVEYRTMVDQLKAAGESKGAEGAKKFNAPLRDELQNPTMKQAMEDNLAVVINQWVGAQKPDAAIVPTAYTVPGAEDALLASAARGGKIFYGSCISCHQNMGRESNLTYDAWATIVRGRNLYDGIYRGGRRPVDLYNRVHGGIEGAGMTAYKDIKSSLTAQALNMPEAEFANYDPLWDIVNFLRAVPYRDLRERLRERLKTEFKIDLPE
jgi:mono/diheme cytochrome c family protein